MSINRGIDKENMEHIDNGIFLIHTKQQICVTCRDVDEPRDYHTEWNKSEREEQILYNTGYIWNL